MSGEQSKNVDDGELSVLCVEMMRLVAEIDAAKRELERSVRDGYFHLAKSRLSMGKERLSRSSYAAEMRARVMINCSKDDKDDDFVALPRAAFRRKRNVEEEMRTHERNKQHSSKVEEAVPSYTNSKPLPDDPIFWFGILLPRSLHQARSCFTQATRISCEICSLEAKLKRRRAKYNEMTSLPSQCA